MKHYTTLFLILLVLTTGCASKMRRAWLGFKEPQSTDFINLNGHDSCMKIGIQNLNSVQRKSLLEAAADVCAIFHNDAFRQQITARSWVASCKSKNSDFKTMSGADVYRQIMQKIPDYSIHPRNPPYDAIGQTWNEMQRVAIRPDRIAGWYSSSRQGKADLINTIAHETMHIISYSFRDDGHGDGCPDENLVSYGIGDLVEEIWLRTH